MGAAALGGAVLGDNIGYWVARRLGQRAETWIDANPKRAGLKARASGILDRRGGPSVFLTCWLFAPLGPTMNYVYGLSKFDWRRFVIWGIAGEIIWVTLYVGLGYGFGDNITAISSLLGNASGFVTALVVVAGLGWWLIRAARKGRAQQGA